MKSWRNAHLPTEQARVKARLARIEAELGLKLTAIRSTVLAPEKVAGHHCENLIGAAQLPLGVAGPVRIVGQFAGEYLVPLATTEGALVASVNRGCKAVNESGGATVRVENAGVTRAPVFAVDSLDQAKELADWLEKNWANLCAAVCRQEKHLSLTDYRVWPVGRYVFVRFVFDSSEAMGMNMATIATQVLARRIEQETSARLVALSGNLCVDKKPAWANALLGRGKKVWAEVELPLAVVKKLLHTTPARVREVVQVKDQLGALVGGSLGANAHYANIIAALFLATGQDPAHVVEGSLGITTASEQKAGGLVFSVFLPAVMVGTVGGGTSLPTQREALALLGCGSAVSGSSETLAAVVGGAVLAGELSLTAALAAGELAQAHQQLGRGKK